MKKIDTKNLISLILNALNFIIVFLCVLSFFTTGGVGNMAIFGTKAFIFFTVDSNILMALTSLLVIIYNIKAIKEKKELELNKTVKIFKFLGVVAVMVTFLTVMFFLGPTQGYIEMLEGTNFFLHLLCPIMAFVSFAIFEAKSTVSIKENIFSLIPTFIYSIVYLTCVVSKTWTDFYGFTFGGKMEIIPLSFIVMLAFTYLIGFVTLKTQKFFNCLFFMKEE